MERPTGLTDNHTPELTMLNIPQALKEDLLGDTIKQLRFIRSIWAVESVEIDSLYYDTYTGLERITVDATYPPFDNIRIRIYIYKTDDQFSGPILKESFVANNPDTSKGLIHITSMKSKVFIQVKKSIDKLEVYVPPVVEICPIGELIVGGSGVTANGGITASIGGDSYGTHVGAVAMGTSIFTISYNSQGYNTVLEFKHTGPNYALDGQTPTIVLSNIQTLKIDTAQVVGTAIYMLGRGAHNDKIARIDIDTVSQLTFDSVGFGNLSPSILRYNSVSGLLLAIMGTPALTTVMYSISLDFSVAPLAKVASITLQGTPQSCCMVDKYAILATTNTLYQIDTTDFTAVDISGSWYGSTGMVYSGNNTNVPISSVISLRDGNVFVFAGATSSGPSYFTVIDTSGTQLIPDVVSVPAGLDKYTFPVDSTADRVVLMAHGLPTGAVTYSCVEVDTTTGQFHTYSTYSSPPSTPLIKKAWLALDRAVYEPSTDLTDPTPTNPGSAPKAAPCPLAPQMSTQDLEWFQNPHRNNF